MVIFPLWCTVMRRCPNNLEGAAHTVPGQLGLRELVFCTTGAPSAEGAPTQPLLRSSRARRVGAGVQRAASTSSAELAFSPGPGSTASQLTTPSSMMAA